MSSYNKVILMGNLTRDPELRYTQNNLAICKIGLAVNRRFQDQSGEWRDEATFIDVTIFGKRGEAFAKFHNKGKAAFIEGRLRLETWEEQGGQKRSKLSVIGENWEFVGGGRGQENGGGYSGGGGGYREQRAAGGGGGGGYSAPDGDYGRPEPDYLEVDDTPF